MVVGVFVRLREENCPQAVFFSLLSNAAPMIFLIPSRIGRINFSETLERRALISDSLDEIPSPLFFQYIIFLFFERGTMGWKK